jgi:peptidoglycan lytic transglycosylase
MKDRHNFIFGIGFFTAISIPLPLGHLTSVLDFPNISPTITITNSKNLHVPTTGNQCDATLAAAPAGTASICSDAVNRDCAHPAEIMAAHNNVPFELDEIINFKTSLGLDQKGNAVGTGVTIVGVASTYNPYRPGRQEGGKETASGEPYDPIEWTAAIQTDLREKFGGVSYGKQYRPAYALVEGAAKKAIIKINDVGPLKPGRVIDFNEQTMRYFDPTLKLGLIHGVMITPLVGNDWPTGPIE